MTTLTALTAEQREIQAMAREFAQREIAPRAAALMARELGQDSTWEAAQLTAFAEIARGYLPA